MIFSKSSMPRLMLFALLVILLVTTLMVVPAVAEDDSSSSATISMGNSGEDSQSSITDSSASTTPSDTGGSQPSPNTSSQDQTSTPISDTDDNASNQGEPSDSNLNNGTLEQIPDTGSDASSTNDVSLSNSEDSNLTNNTEDQTPLPAADANVPDSSQTENQDSTSGGSDAQPNIPASDVNSTDAAQNSVQAGSPSGSTGENSINNEEETTVVTIPQSDAAMGDPYGFVYDAVTEGVVSGVALEVYLIEGETSTLVTDTTPKNVYTGDGTGSSVAGKYSFILSQDGTYQIKYSKTGYVDYLSAAQLFNTTATYDLGSLYLVPLVTDADGNDITLKHDLVTNGQDITIINAKDILLNTNITIDTRSVNSEGKFTGAGSVDFSASQDITENAGINVNIFSKDLTLNATRNLSLNGTMNIDTREYNSLGVMTGNAGTITSIVYGTVTISDDVTSPGANVDFTAPTITLGNNVVIDTRQIDGSGELTGSSGALDFNSSGTITIGSGSSFYSGGFDASAADFTFNGAATISSSVYNNEGIFSAGLADLTAANDLTLTHNLSTLGGNLTLTGTNITVNDNVVIDTRQMDDEDVTTAKSGNLLFNAEESINVKTGAKLLAGVSQGSGYNPGIITLTASNQGLVGYSFIDVDNDGDVVSCLFVEPTTATITVNGTLEAGDIVIRASAGQIEELTDLGEDDQPGVDCALAKLTEYLSEIIPLPVAIKVRDNQAYININSGATINSTGNLTIESNAISEAEAQAIFYALAIGYCEADATADTQIKGGANLNAAGDVLIRSNASTSAEMKAWTINFKNSVGSLVLGITNNNLTSKAVVGQNANINGRNINIQALGDNSNQASASATAV
ncbi:MAG: beta strand repeat-containing protein, partial [Ignavibacteriales bacterium]